MKNLFVLALTFALFGCVTVSLSERAGKITVLKSNDARLPNCKELGRVNDVAVERPLYAFFDAEAKEQAINNLRDAVAAEYAPANALVIDYFLAHGGAFSDGRRYAAQ